MSDQSLPASISINTGGAVNVGGDVVGRDKIIGYTSEQVSLLLSQISKNFQSKPFDGRCPYRGLEAFGEEDSEYFFGRERLVTELVERVKQARCVVITGPSGSGKSSLVRAGLISALKRGALPYSDRWRYETLTPGRSPLDQLARVASSLAGRLNAGDDIRSRGLTDATLLHQWAEVALGDGPERRAFIVVDQFEETFTQVARERESERAAFLNLLTHAATVETSRVTVLFVMRSDFISNCATYPDLNRLLNRQFFQVGAMPPDELVSAIARPALQVGLRIDPDLIAQIINDMQDEPGALPLMQFALKDLFDAQQMAGGVIALTLEGYLARGGLHKALERHADAAFAQLSPVEQELAHAIFTKLIQPGRGKEDTRRTATFEELTPAGEDEAPVEAVVWQLAEPQLRLITTDEREENGLRVRTATIAHEKLIDAWPWLRRLVNDNREAIALQNEIADDARDWEQSGRDPSYLYAGARLITAREKLTAKKLVLSELAQTFVEASSEAREAARRAEEARRQAEIEKERQTAARLRRRNRVITIAGVLALIAAVTAVFFGLQANANARLALSRQLAAQAVSHLDNQLDLALLLGMEADGVEHTAEARSSLLTGLQSSPRLMSFISGHTDAVRSVAFSPDRKTLASGSQDGTIILWDISNPQSPTPLGAPLTGHTDVVSSVAISPDGKTLASGSDDKTIHLWDISNPKSPVPLGAPLTGHTDSVWSVAISPDGKTLASGSWDNTIRLWNISNPQSPVPLGVPLTGHTAYFGVAFSPDGKTLASGSWDKTIRLWDISNPQSPVPLGVPLIGHRSAVLSVAISPDGKTLASGSWDNTIRLWNISNPKSPVPLGAPLTGHTDSVWSVAISPDGKTLASGSWDNTIRLGDISNPKSPVQLGAPLTGHVYGVMSVAISPDGKMLASGSADNTIRLWDMSNPKSPVPLGVRLIGHTNVVRSVAISPDGKTLASGSADKTSILWDISNPQSPAPLGAPLTVHTDTVRSVAISPDGKTLASGSFDNMIRLWDISNPKSPVPLGAPLTGHRDWVLSVAFSPDGKTLASGSKDNTIRLWDISNPQSPIPLGAPLTGHTNYVLSVAFSPDGKTLASGSDDNTIRLWDISNPKSPVPFGAPLTGHTSYVISVAISPDGKTLASGSWDNTIRLWDISNPQSPVPLGAPLTGHTSYVWSVAISPDGKKLASGSGDKNIILWDISNPKSPVPLGAPLTGHTDTVYSVVFSPDGKTLASGSGDKTIILWDVSFESWKVRACNIVARNLTQAEWKQYLGGEPYHKTCAQWPAGK